MNLPELNFPEFELKIQSIETGRQIFDPVRKKFIALTPEEWVRQHLIHYLTIFKGYPMSLLSIESGYKKIGMAKRTDLLAYSKNGEILLLAECKAPEVKITQAAFNQSWIYNLEKKARYIVVTNGLKHYCFQVESGKEPQPLDQIPEYSVY